ncbi:capsule biosynthesis protein [Burkholderiaceae bacterium 16]|nr:capsule biosynthesis protein [Burkholderiaceae bacterium 16]
MTTIFRLFKAHPASVGESYLQHMSSSFSFGASMLFASMAALVHGILPFLFVTTGSNTISRLHERMVTHRNRMASRHR